MRIRMVAWAVAVGAGAAAQAGGLPTGVRAVKAGASPSGDGRSWETAYADLQSALDEAAGSPGTVTEIWVTAGVYVPSRRAEPLEPRSATFQLVDGVGVYGGFAGGESARAARDFAANQTVLSGETASGRVFHVVTGSGTGPGAVLDGFTVRDGQAIGATVERGGGVLVLSGGPRLANLTVRGNTARGGAGVYLEGTAELSASRVESNKVLAFGIGGAGVWLGPDAVMADCVVTLNSGLSFSGGGVAGSGTAVRCRIIGNTADEGGGVHGPGRYLDCEISGNRADAGGGVSGSGGMFRNCIISGNMAGLSGNIGGGVYGAGTFAGCLIRGNSAFISSAVHATGPVSLINCTVLDHSGSPKRPTLSGGLTITNSIVWGTGMGEASQLSGGAVDHSIVRYWTGSLGGVGNSGDDPMLTAEGRPPAGSPAVDTGSNGGVPLGLSRDLDGMCRVADGDANGTAVVDRGAYELQTCPANCDCSTGSPLLNVSDFLCFQTRFAAGDPYANCDGSTVQPVLNVNDFVCFLTRYAAGCAQ